MQLYAARHGETAWNKEEVFRGRKDVPLSGTEKKQTQLTGQYFLNKGITRIFSSPPGRAIETAKGISIATKKHSKGTSGRKGSNNPGKSPCHLQNYFSLRSNYSKLPLLGHTV
jgi:bisphosphoglycerate-dependent phosphoglycerate mutase